MMSLISSLPLRNSIIGIALGATVIALTGPSVIRETQVIKAIAFLDITGSMNARNVDGDGDTTSRLEAARTLVRDLAQRMPCGSSLGLGIFTERRSFLLFNPVNVCENYAAFQGSLDEIDWRMAWEGDSYVARGLYSAIRVAGSLQSDVIFLTDGHEAPPLPHHGVTPFEGKLGEVKGLIVGVGDDEKIPIPKFDDDGRESGTWSEADVPHVNRHGLPPADASNEPNYHPRNAPFGGNLVMGDEHLTSLKREHLASLAAMTGLTLVTPSSGASLSEAMLQAAQPHTIKAAVDYAYLPASLALFLTIAAFVLAVVQSLKLKARYEPEGSTV